MARNQAAFSQNGMDDLLLAMGGYVQAETRPFAMGESGIRAAVYSGILPSDDQDVDRDLSVESLQWSQTTSSSGMPT
jgi:hypothetical protein